MYRKQKSITVDSVNDLIIINIQENDFEELGRMFDDIACEENEYYDDYTERTYNCNPESIDIECEEYTLTIYCDDSYDDITCYINSKNGDDERDFVISRNLFGRCLYTGEIRLIIYHEFIICANREDEERYPEIYEESMREWYK